MALPAMACLQNGCEFDGFVGMERLSKEDPSQDVKLFMGQDIFSSPTFLWSKKTFLPFDKTF